MSKPFKKSVNIEELIEQKNTQVEALRHQCYAVEKMISISTEQLHRIEYEGNSIASQSAQLELRLECLERQLADNCKFMGNLSKVSGEQLQQRHDTLTKNVSEAEAANAALRAKMEETIRRKEQELLQWEHEIDAKQLELDEKALSFGLTLKNALGKIARIV